MGPQEWDQRYAEAELLWSAEPNRFLAAEVAGLPPGRALDVAAGEGRNAIWLAEQGWRATAVDFSEVAIAKGRRLAEARGVDVEWVVADVTRYRPDRGAFDLVAVCYLHLPAEERRTVLAVAAAAVAPGGTLLVVGHDRTNLTEGHGGPQDPAILLAPEEVAAELPGLTVVRAERVRRDGAIDTLVRAQARGRHDPPAPARHPRHT